MTLPRLLAGLDHSGALTFDRHLAVHGEPVLLTSRRSRSAPPLLDELRQAGLQGRGGAGFPIARKLAAVLGARGRPIVVVNACEGEPASQKDRMLIERTPHLVIDGALACAEVVDAERIVFAVDGDAQPSKWALQRALDERPGGGRRGRPADVVAVPAGYVSGQESAIVNFLNRGQALPTATPPMVFERGVARRPTLVSNVETLAHVALIDRHGADWFRAVGTIDQPGSTLVTLTGGVPDPGVFEIEYGVILNSLIDSAGGPIAPIRAVLFGGYGGTWMDGPAALGLPLAAESLRSAGASLGPGVILALPQTACPVAEVVRVATWLAGQGAHQCGPCTNGLSAIATTLAAVADGRGGAEANGRLIRWAGLVTGRGACAHPDGTARFVTSALRVFADEFADHAHYGPCPACHRPPVLPLPQRLAVAA